MVKFQNISKIYHPDYMALDSVNLEIQPKEFVSLVGRSGAGKTTLLRLLIGEERPTHGRVFLDNIEINKLSSGDLPRLRRRIGVVFQDFKLLSNKNAFENIAFALEASGAPDKQIKEDVPQVLELVGLKDKANHFPCQLSGGEKQRVAMARALINRPDIIVADEPTGNLDPIHSGEIIGLLLKINSLGTTIILATHNQDIVNGLKRRVVTMEAGKVIRDEEKGKYNI